MGLDESVDTSNPIPPHRPGRRRTLINIISTACLWVPATATTKGSLSIILMRLTSDKVTLQSVRDSSARPSDKSTPWLFGVLDTNV